MSLCVSPLQLSDNSDEDERLLALFFQHSVLPILTVGASQPGIGVHWYVRLCICGLQTWNRSLSPNPTWHLLPSVNVYGVQGAPTKIARQAIDKWCSEDVFVNTRGSSLIFSPNISQTGHHGARIRILVMFHIRLRTIRRIIPGLTIDSPCGVWGRGWPPYVFCDGQRLGLCF